MADECRPLPGAGGATGDPFESLGARLENWCLHFVTNAELTPMRRAAPVQVISPASTDSRMRAFPRRGSSFAATWSSSHNLSAMSPRSPQPATLPKV